MKFATKTDAGLKREINEDCAVVKEISQNALLAVVCDGMGGENGGEVASRLACDIIEKKVSENFYDSMTLTAIKALLIGAAQSANGEVFAKACASPCLNGMGTTVVAALINERAVNIIHAGDSRAYMINPSSNTIIRLTRDHSVVQTMIERGEITEKEARNHPKKNLITRALGGESEIRVDYCLEEPGENDILLLCSDGVTGFIDDEQILDICRQEDAQKIATALVDCANSNGGGDNITVAVITNMV